MSIPDIINRCIELGINLIPEGEKLHVDAPRGVLNDEMLALLRTHKQEILENRRRRRFVFMRITEASAELERKYPGKIDWTKDSVMVRTTNAALDEAMTTFINGECELTDVQLAWRNYIKALEGQFSTESSLLAPRQSCFL